MHAVLYYLGIIMAFKASSHIIWFKIVVAGSLCLAPLQTSTTDILDTPGLISHYKKKPG